MTDIAPDERTDFKGQMSIFWDELRAMLATIDALTTENATLKAALGDVVPFLDEFDGSIYGGFMGGDPRRFIPDPECCTPDEIERHAKACAEWDAGEGADRGPGCAFLGDGATALGGGFGIGTTIFETPEEIKRARVLAGKEAQSE